MVKRRDGESVGEVIDRADHARRRCRSTRKMREANRQLVRDYARVLATLPDEPESAYKALAVVTAGSRVA
jgi:hypothetical protein